MPRKGGRRRQKERGEQKSSEHLPMLSENEWRVNSNPNNVTNVLLTQNAVVLKLRHDNSEATTLKPSKEKLQMKIVLKDGSEHHVDSAVAQALTAAGAVQQVAAFLPSNSEHNAEIEEAIDSEKPIAWLLREARAISLKVGDTVEMGGDQYRFRAEVANITTCQLPMALNLVLVNLRRVEESA